MAFLRRAALAQSLTNCITELLPEQAESRAKELDDYLLQHKKSLVLLHGLPISVKEVIGMKDLGLNAGYIARWGKTTAEDAHVLQGSNLYGVTASPFNRDVTCGGSSRGEGALIGMRGSCLGIGSDIGGNIRIQAANFDIYGLKPKTFRVPTDGWCSTMAGADSVAVVIGPMSTSLSGLSLFMKTIIDAKPWLAEPALIPLLWNSTLMILPTNPLKIGGMWIDGVVKSHPPTVRAMKELTIRLKILPNVEMVDWKGHLHGEAWEILSSLYFTDGGAEDTATLAESGEPWCRLTNFIIKENPCFKKFGPQQISYWQEEREAYRKDYAKVWNETATLKNVRDELQVSKVDKSRDLLNENFIPLTRLDQENFELYDPEEFVGLPISLQLVAHRFADGKVLAILE